MKSYKAIFFDWDGTAVLSRKAPVTGIVPPMKRLLAMGVKLVIVSGTTYENIAEGELSGFFTPEELANLYLGLGRGAYNYRFDDGGKPYIWKQHIPDKPTLLTIHDVCYEVHKRLLNEYDFPTDIVFSRPNYCKIDLMVDSSRGEQLFLQENEAAQLLALLRQHGFAGGFRGLLALAMESASRRGISLSATTDAKYLEVGLSDKSSNVDTVMEHLVKEYGIDPSECCFWGDEYVGLDEGLYGSDSFMMTPLSKAGDFYDVSDISGIRPEGVKVTGGGVGRFLEFLKEAGENTIQTAMEMV